MEEKKLKINGEHFAEVLESEINKLLARVSAKRAELGKVKSNPLLKLIDSGRMTKEYVLTEMPKLQNKTSTLPSGERAVLRDIIATAIRRTAIETAQKESEEGKGKQEKGK